MATLTSVLAGLPSMGFGIGLSPQVGIALALTLIGSLSTALGGALVVLQAVPDIKRLGLLQRGGRGGEERRRLKDVADEKEAEVGEREMQRRRQAVLWSGVITALGISLHNFPEGIAVFLGTMKVRRSGKVLLVHDGGGTGVGEGKEDLLVYLWGTDGEKSLAVAIALHNIPEGLAVALPSASACLTFPSLPPTLPSGCLAVALPIYFGTRSRWAAFRAAALSWAAEPLGVIFVALFFLASLAPDIIEGLLAGGTCPTLSSPFLGSRWAAFRAAALSGAAEPLGVIFVALFFPASLAPDIIEGLLAGSTCSALSRCWFSPFCFLRWHVASAAPFTLHVLPVLACASLLGGIMAFLVLHEMLPLAFEYAGHRRAVQAMFLGMAVMSANLHLLALSLPPDISL
ncbi:unnamed protein product [Closterium sp. Naga37s-1]|nr:unnamed protein product [Closterium sp. Naga37s-1]